MAESFRRGAFVLGPAAIKVFKINEPEDNVLDRARELA